MIVARFWRVRDESVGRLDVFLLWSHGQIPHAPKSDFLLMRDGL